MKEEKCEKENFNNRLFSEVANKGDVVRLYGEFWYAMEIEDGIVKLIMMNSTKEIKKVRSENNRDFCQKLDEFSQKYVKGISYNRKLLHTKVQSCQKEDIEKYLGLKVCEWKSLTDRVWCTGYAYWLASLYPGTTYFLWYVLGNGSVSNDWTYTYYVRPVICLKSDVNTIGKDEDGVWILEEEQESF